MISNLFDDIAPAQALGIGIASWNDGRVELVAPLEPNRNDKGTAFAGSIASMLALAGWAAITLSLREAGIEAEVMIVKSEMEYVAAANTALFAEAAVPEEETARIVQELNGRGRSRIALQAHLHSGATGCASMSASYAVIRTAK